MTRLRMARGRGREERQGYAREGKVKDGGERYSKGKRENGVEICQEMRMVMRCGVKRQRITRSGPNR